MDVVLRHTQEVTIHDMTLLTIWMQFYVIPRTLYNAKHITRLDVVLRHTQDVRLRFKCKYKVRNLDAVLRRTQDLLYK